METISKKVWELMLGYEPGRELKEMIFAEMERDKLPIDEVSQRYAMPEMFILKTTDPDEQIEFMGEQMTLAQFQARYPFKKHIIITKRKYEKD